MKNWSRDDKKDQLKKCPMNSTEWYTTIYKNAIEWYTAIYKKIFKNLQTDTFFSSSENEDLGKSNHSRPWLKKSKPVRNCFLLRTQWYWLSGKSFCHCWDITSTMDSISSSYIFTIMPCTDGLCLHCKGCNGLTECTCTQ